MRTWLFRGTLHFVAASDLAWLTALLAPRIVKTDRRRYKQLALDAAAARFAGFNALPLTLHFEAIE